MLTTATGKTFPTSFFVHNRRSAHVTVENITLSEAAQVFGDPKELPTIEVDGITLSGYTVLSALAPKDGAVMVSLWRD